MIKLWDQYGGQMMLQMEWNIEIREILYLDWIFMFQISKLFKLIWLLCYCYDAEYEWVMMHFNLKKA